jgi:hypothetical protein
MKICIFGSFICLLTNYLFAQVPDSQVNGSPQIATQTATNTNFPEPKHVLVVYKNNDTVSRDIKNHYVQKRDIPQLNVIGLSFPSQNGTEPVILTQEGEEIIRNANCSVDGLDAKCDNLAWSYYQDNIAAPITNYLTNTIDPSTGMYLKDQIRYIVLCKGIPLKIKAADQYHLEWNSNISVDGLLSILPINNNGNPAALSMYANNTIYITNPYYGIDADCNLTYRFLPNHFSTGGYTLSYMVSRLDGLNYSDVIQLIDRSAAPDYSGEGAWVIDPYTFYDYETAYSAGYNYYDQDVLVDAKNRPSLVLM